MPKPLYNREDARRLARTLLDTRKAQGESIPEISTRRMASLTANALAVYAARPERFRTVTLVSVGNKCVVFRRSCDAR